MRENVIAFLAISAATHLDFNIGTKSHLEFILGVFGKDSLEGLLEQRGVKGVSHHHVATESKHSFAITLKREPNN